MQRKYCTEEQSVISVPTWGLKCCNSDLIAAFEKWAYVTGIYCWTIWIGEAWMSLTTWVKFTTLYWPLRLSEMTKGVLLRYLEGMSIWTNPESVTKADHFIHIQGLSKPERNFSEAFLTKAGLSKAIWEYLKNQMLNVCVCSVSEHIETVLP